MDIISLGFRLSRLVSITSHRHSPVFIWHCLPFAPSQQFMSQSKLPRGKTMVSFQNISISYWCRTGPRPKLMIRQILKPLGCLATCWFSWLCQVYRCTGKTGMRRGTGLVCCLMMSRRCWIWNSLTSLSLVLSSLCALRKDTKLEAETQDNS